MEEKRKQIIGNLGIPLLPVHKMDQIEQNKMKDLLFNIGHQTSPKTNERDWNQMKVMLPILKQSVAHNFKRNNLIID